jgi:C4-dicarboxylate-specific signal transduction histidine kinase
MAVSPRHFEEEALAIARSELESVAGSAILAVLAAAIAHEINQPLSGIVNNSNTCLRMLQADPPNVDGALEATRRTLRDGNRASDVIARMRALFSRKEVIGESLDLNDAAREVIALLLGDLQRNRVILREELADYLPRVQGDRIQIQQVILNLVRNASDAMSNVEDRPRELWIRTRTDECGRVRLTVRDMGVGFDPACAETLFQPFHTTKSDGMGIGLCISRSIIEAHRGRLWAELNDGPGCTFAFSLPASRRDRPNPELAWPSEPNQEKAHAPSNPWSQTESPAKADDRERHNPQSLDRGFASYSFQKHDHLVSWIAF